MKTLLVLLLAAGSAAADPKSLSFSDHDVNVTVKLDAPAGWTESVRTRGATYESPGMGRSRITVTLSCLGNCEPPTKVAAVKKRIPAEVKEHFDFVSSARQIPKLTAKWVTPTVEEKPGTFFARWSASGPNSEQHVELYWIVPGTAMVIDCQAEITEIGSGPARENFEPLLQACRGLTFTQLK